MNAYERAVRDMAVTVRHCTEQHAQPFVTDDVVTAFVRTHDGAFADAMNLTSAETVQLLAVLDIDRLVAKLFRRHLIALVSRRLADEADMLQLTDPYTDADRKFDAAVDNA